MKLRRAKTRGEPMNSLEALVGKLMALIEHFRFDRPQALFESEATPEETPRAGSALARPDCSARSLRRDGARRGMGYEQFVVERSTIRAAGQRRRENQKSS